MSTVGGAGGSNGVGLLQGRSSLKGTLVVAGESTGPSRQDRDSIITQITSSKSASLSQERASKFMSLSGAKRASEIAADGISQIAAIRSEQASLIAENATSQLGEKNVERATRIEELDNEVTRIVNSATYNSRNILTQNTTYNLESSTAGVSDSVTLLSAQSAIDVGQYKYTTPDQALEAYEVYYNASSSASDLAGKAESTVVKATEVLESAVVAAKEDPSLVTDPDEAEQIAQRIVSELSSPYASEISKSQIIDATIGSLSSERAQELLS